MHVKSGKVKIYSNISNDFSYVKSEGHFAKIFVTVNFLMYLLKTLEKVSFFFTSACIMKTYKIQ